MVNDITPSKSRNRSLRVGFGIRLCLWLLLVSAAIQNYFVGPRVEQFLLDRGIDVPWGVILAWRALHLVNVYFLLLAMLVMIDGIGLLVTATNRAAPNASRTWWLASGGVSWDGPMPAYTGSVIILACVFSAAACGLRLGVRGRGGLAVAGG